MTFFANLILFLALSLTVGLGSAWYALEHGLPLTTRTLGPWVIWHSAGKLGSDPYTAAYVARTGGLPITSSHALYYVAKQDNAKRQISSDCVYKLSGVPLDADWWSISIYGKDGLISPNTAKRYAFNSSNIVRQSDGSFSIFLSKAAMPGNWLPLPADADQKIVLRIFGPREGDETGDKKSIEQNLPKIMRQSCL